MATTTFKIPLAGIISNHVKTIQSQPQRAINNIFRLGTTAPATRTVGIQHTPPVTKRFGNTLAQAARNLFS